MNGSPYVTDAANAVRLKSEAQKRMRYSTLILRVICFIPLKYVVPIMHIAHSAYRIVSHYRHNSCGSATGSLIPAPMRSWRGAAHWNGGTRWFQAIPIPCIAREFLCVER